MTRILSAAHRHHLRARQHPILTQVATNRFRTFQKEFSVPSTPQRGDMSIENGVFARSQAEESAMSINRWQLALY